jgi:hypothetical protein
MGATRDGLVAAKQVGRGAAATRARRLVGRDRELAEVIESVALTPLTAVAGRLPDGFSLPIHAATHDHGVGVCIWEGPSVEAVRELVESVVGPFSQNEYFEMSVDGLS